MTKTNTKTSVESFSISLVDLHLHVKQVLWNSETDNLDQTSMVYSQLHQVQCATNRVNREPSHPQHAALDNYGNANCHTKARGTSSGLATLIRNHRHCANHGHTSDTDEFEFLIYHCRFLLSSIDSRTAVRIKEVYHLASIIVYLGLDDELVQQIIPIRRN